MLFMYWYGGKANQNAYIICLLFNYIIIILREEVRISKGLFKGNSSSEKNIKIYPWGVKTNSHLFKIKIIAHIF